MLFIKSNLFLLVASVLIVQCNCRKAFSQEVRLDVIFYNVENLFDTIDDPFTDDAEFLPDGRYKWSSERYLHKLDQLGRVIAGDGKGALPSIIGLCEIENRRVLEDLAGSDKLRKAGYEIVHYDSPDERGIDVALMYKPGDMHMLSSEALPVRVPFDLDFRTRDILYVCGVIGLDTVHFYVNHWPSRRGGAEVSEPKRIQAAHVLRSHLDALSPRFKRFNVIIMGDLNDEPGDRSVKEVLKTLPVGTGCSSPAAPCLYNLSRLIPEGTGTYYYWRDKKWNVLDHMILSASLLETNGSVSAGEVRWLPGGFLVAKAPWMLKEDNGAMVPFSSYARDYEGGFSDHLPVKITLVVKTETGKRCRWNGRRKK